MTVKTWVIAGAAAFLLLATAGIGYAAGRANDGPEYRSGPGAWSMMGPAGWGAMQAVHDSPWMESMHDRMPADLRERCDRWHDAMPGWPGGTSGYGPMTGGSMMGGGMMGGGAPASGSGGTT